MTEPQLHTRPAEYPSRGWMSRPRPHLLVIRPSHRCCPSQRSKLSYRPHCSSSSSSVFASNSSNHSRKSLPYRRRRWSRRGDSPACPVSAAYRCVHWKPNAASWQQPHDRQVSAWMSTCVSWSRNRQRRSRSCSHQHRQRLRAKAVPCWSKLLYARRGQRVDSSVRGQRLTRRRVVYSIWVYCSMP